MNGRSWSPHQSAHLVPLGHQARRSNGRCWPRAVIQQGRWYKDANRRRGSVCATTWAPPAEVPMFWTLFYRYSPAAPSAQNDWLLLGESDWFRHRKLAPLAGAQDNIMPTPIPSADDGGTTRLPCQSSHMAHLLPDHASRPGASCSPLPHCRPCWCSWQRPPGWPECASRASSR